MNTLLVIAIALILGLLSTRLMKLIGLPNVTGYLVVGLIIGPYALGGFIPSATVLTMLKLSKDSLAPGMKPPKA